MDVWKIDINFLLFFFSRAIYFWAYSTAKRNVNNQLPKSNRDTPFVHVTSAAMAGNFFFHAFILWKEEVFFLF